MTSTVYTTATVLAKEVQVGDALLGLFVIEVAPSPNQQRVTIHGQAKDEIFTLQITSKTPVSVMRPEQLPDGICKECRERQVTSYLSVCNRCYMRLWRQSSAPNDQFESIKQVMPENAFDYVPDELALHRADKR